MRQKLFNYVKKLVPKISETELIALRTGNTCLDRQIYQGKVSLPTIKPLVGNTLRLDWNEKVEKLLNKFPDKVYPNPIGVR